MKINFVSDLHLEMGYQELPGGEVLILAGDIAEVKNIQRHYHETKLVSSEPNFDFVCSEFFRYECQKYEKVFYVMGNHEHYRWKFKKTAETIRNIMPSNVTLLDNQVEEYNGVMFLGGTLWTDCNRDNPLTKVMLSTGMNDYHVITYNDDNGYYKLRPDHTVFEHQKTVKYFKEVLAENTNKPFVVITHHAPSFMSINEKYKSDVHMNGGYASELTDLILDNPNIKYWIHGHMHDPVQYQVGETTVISNPRGYIGWEDGNGFDPARAIEL
jgi:Icc-related predicted phosphoesterase